MQGNKDPIYFQSNISIEREDAFTPRGPAKQQCQWLPHVHDGDERRESAQAMAIGASHCHRAVSIRLASYFKRDRKIIAVNRWPIWRSGGNT
jgi:hypothetical protein